MIGIYKRLFKISNCQIKLEYEHCLLNYPQLSPFKVVKYINPSFQILKIHGRTCQHHLFRKLQILEKSIHMNCDVRKMKKKNEKNFPISKGNNPIFGDPTITIIFFTSLFLLMFSAVLSIFTPDTVEWTLITIILATVSSSIFFPLMAGYFYDKFKEKQEGESIWRVFKEFSEGGILRVYKDREESDSEENAVYDLRKAFDEHRQGKIKILGVSLRVFFSQTGPFYNSITNIADLHKFNSEVGIQALVSDPDSPEVINRVKIETPDRLDDPLIKKDINLTIASLQNLTHKYGSTAIEYGYFSSAPYCTCIIFPSKCYFSPNILSEDPPVRLPMIIFSANSHAYTKLEQYFDYLWENRIKLPFSKERGL